MDTGYPPVPHLVAKAEELARLGGFTSSCGRRTGSLLSTLAAATSGRILELGSGCGVGSAWLASGMRGGSRLTTIELDRDRHEAVASLFAGLDDVAALHGDWRRALEGGPFDLAFVDVGEAKDAGSDRVISSMSVGGVILLDDFTPGPLFRGEFDERWHRWMRDPRLVSCELVLEPDTVAIVATRVG